MCKCGLYINEKQINGASQKCIHTKNIVWIHKINIYIYIYKQIYVIHKKLYIICINILNGVIYFLLNNFDKFVQKYNKLGTDETKYKYANKHKYICTCIYDMCI